MWKCGGIVLVLLGLAAAFNATKRVSYDGFTVYKVTINNTDDAKIISKLDGETGYNFWTGINLLNHEVDIMVAPDYKDKFIRFVEEHKLPYKVLIEDVGKLADQQISTKNRNADDDDEVRSVSEYMDYSEMLTYLNKLTNITNPETNEQILRLVTIGKTARNNDVYMVKISSDHSQKKPIILLDAAMHAREWAGPPTVLYLIKQLTENFTTNKEMLRKVDFYIIPVANPDGYEYTRKYDRMWRKTRSEQGGCIGVDGNRNFNYYWGVSGASKNPCSETYMGPAPFSEIEARNIKAVGKRYQGRILGYMAVHSYGSFLLYPWGYSQDEVPADWRRLDTCAKNFVNSVKKYSGTEYTYGSSARVLYEAAGGSDDWFKGKLGVPFAYTLELPGSDSEGFHLSESKLHRVGQETFIGFKSLLSCILKYYNTDTITLPEDYEDELSDSN